MTLEGIDTSSYGEKRPRRSPSNAEAQKEWAIVLEKFLDLASDYPLALGDCLAKTNIPLEVLAGNPPSVEEVRMDAPSEVVIAPAPPPDLTRFCPRKKWLPRSSGGKHICSATREGSFLDGYDDSGS